MTAESPLVGTADFPSPLPTALPVPLLPLQVLLSLLTITLSSLSCPLVTALRHMSALHHQRAARLKGVRPGADDWSDATFLLSGVTNPPPHPFFFFYNQCQVSELW